MRKFGRLAGWQYIKNWNEKLENHVDKLFSDREWFLNFWVLITICWVPAYLAWFPGIFGYDAPIQAAQYYGELELTSHHPLVHTWLLGSFLKLGELINDYNWAYAVYTGFQMLLVTGSLAYCFAFLKKRKVSIILVLAGIIWIITNPILQVLTFNATKDVLFGAFMLCFMVDFLEVLNSADLTRGTYVKMFVSGLLMCLFRNQGIYMVIALGIFCLLCRIDRRKMYGCMLGIMCSYFVFGLVTSGVFGIPKGDKREMLSLPMQQVAAVGYNQINYENQNISDENMELMMEVIPEEYILAWNPVTADPVKSGFVTEAFGENFFAHVINYLKIGVQNPGTYLNEFYHMISPYLDMSNNPFRPMTYEYTFPQLNQWGIERKSLLEFYMTYLQNIMVAAEIPLGVQHVVCVCGIIVVIGLAIGKRDKYLFLGVLLPLLYFGTILLGPVALLRYTYPLILAVPMVLGLSAEALRENG